MANTFKTSEPRDTKSMIFLMAMVNKNERIVSFVSLNRNLTLFRVKMNQILLSMIPAWFDSFRFVSVWDQGRIVLVAQGSTVSHRPKS